ncbi:MAG: DUF5694 domain-containing protein [Acidobacteriota bacterium]
MPTVRSYILLLGLLIASALPAAPFDPAEIEVTVLGVNHLLQGGLELPSKAIDDAREALAEFEADQVVVEWLHPSIDPATTHNYRPLGDPETLARLWGIDLETLEDQLRSIRELLSTGPKNTTAARLHLGKLTFLAGDPANAAYQWWRAGRFGADVEELGRLTHGNFAGHELEVFGFHLAERWGLEEVTPFDYQGIDADWGKTYSEMMRRAREIALEQVLNLSPSDPSWEEEEARFDSLLNSDTDAWIDRYGGDQRLQQLPRLANFRREMKQLFGDRAADFETATLGFMQTTEANDANRASYYDYLWNLPIANLGRKVVINYEQRNERMVDFIEEDARRLGSKRILVIVGFGHKTFLDTIFEHRGYRVVPSSRFVK